MQEHNFQEAPQVYTEKPLARPIWHVNGKAWRIWQSGSLSKSTGLQGLPLLDYGGKSNQKHSLFYTGLPGFQAAWVRDQGSGVTRAGLLVPEILLR